MELKGESYVTGAILSSFIILIMNYRKGVLVYGRRGLGCFWR